MAQNPPTPLSKGTKNVAIELWHTIARRSAQDLFDWKRKENQKQTGYYQTNPINTYRATVLPNQIDIGMSCLPALGRGSLSSGAAAAAHAISSSGQGSHHRGGWNLFRSNIERALLWASMRYGAFDARNVF